MPKEPENDSDDLADALSFLRAGGVLTRQDWREMSDRDRLIFEAAGMQVSRERALPQPKPNARKKG
jgi:hypothetical protein